jgi:hypothetical protein
MSVGNTWTGSPGSLMVIGLRGEALQGLFAAGEGLYRALP